MTIKDELLAVVRAFNALITGGTAQQLADAKTKITELESAQTLNDSERAEVDTALQNAAAATPPVA